MCVCVFCFVFQFSVLCFINTNFVLTTVAVQLALVDFREHLDLEVFDPVQTHLSSVSGVWCFGFPRGLPGSFCIFGRNPSCNLHTDNLGEDVCLKLVSLRAPVNVFLF